MNKFDVNKLAAQMGKFRNGLAYSVGNMARNFFLDSFKNEGFTDGGLKKWQHRKDSKNTRSLLVRSGALKRSVRLKRYNNRSLEAVLTASAKSKSGFDYASVHNNGEGNMPQRQFMGHSAQLDRQMQDYILKELDKVFK